MYLKLKANNGKNLKERMIEWSSLMVFFVLYVSFFLCVQNMSGHITFFVYSKKIFGVLVYAGQLCLLVWSYTLASEMSSFSSGC